MLQCPDAIFGELCQWLADGKGPVVSASTMCRALQGLGLVRKKKSLHALEQETPRIRRLQRAWRREVAEINPHRLVFMDESGATNAMIRSRDWAPQGQRVMGAVP